MKMVILEKFWGQYSCWGSFKSDNSYCMESLLNFIEREPDIKTDEVVQMILPRMEARTLYGYEMLDLFRALPELASYPRIKEYISLLFDLQLLDKGDIQSLLKVDPEFGEQQ